MSNRNYSNVALPQGLTVSATTASTTLTVANTTGYPTPPFLIGMERGTANEEVVLCTAMTSNTFTVTRAYDGTSAKNHSIGTQVEHTTAAIDYAEAGDHIVATTNVHGLTGGAAVVGTTSTQTLTGKTLDGGSNTITGLNASAITAGTFASARIPTIAYSSLSGIPATFTPASHTHPQSDINGGVIDATTIQGRHIFVQTADPAGSAINGDLWFQTP